MLRKAHKNLIYLFILLIPFYLYFAQPQLFSTVKFGFVKVLSTPIRLLSYPLKEIKKILYYHRTFDEYRRLRRETDVLKARLTGLEEVIRENTRLDQLLEFKRSLVYSSVAANVVGRNPSFWNSTMIIDKGIADGITPGAPVVNAYGVVGKVAEVSQKSSKVILLTDPQFALAGLIKRPRETGLVTGTLKGTCRMRFVNAGADVQIGDKVITSKLSTSFPEGLNIGVIVKEGGNQRYPQQEYIIAPEVSLSQLEEVLVILSEEG